MMESVTKKDELPDAAQNVQNCQVAIVFPMPIKEEGTPMISSKEDQHTVVPERMDIRPRLENGLKLAVEPATNGEVIPPSNGEMAEQHNKPTESGVDEETFLKIKAELDAMERDEPLPGQAESDITENAATTTSITSQFPNVEETECASANVSDKVDTAPSNSTSLIQLPVAASGTAQPLDMMLEEGEIEEEISNCADILVNDLYNNIDKIVDQVMNVKAEPIPEVLPEETIPDNFFEDLLRNEAIEKLNAAAQQEREIKYSTQLTQEKELKKLEEVRQIDEHVASSAEVPQLDEQAVNSAEVPQLDEQAVNSAEVPQLDEQAVDSAEVPKKKKKKHNKRHKEKQTKPGGGNDSGKECDKRKSSYSRERNHTAPKSITCSPRNDSVVPECEKEKTSSSKCEKRKRSPSPKDSAKIFRRRGDEENSSEPSQGTQNKLNSVADATPDLPRTALLRVKPNLCLAAPSSTSIDDWTEVQCLPYVEPTGPSKDTEFTQLDNGSSKSDYIDVVELVEKNITLSERIDRIKKLAADTAADLRRVRENDSMLIGHFIHTATVRKLPASISRTTHHSYDNRSPLHTVNNVSFSFNSNSNSQNLHDFGLAAMPPNIAKIAKTIGLDAQTLHAKLMAGQNKKMKKNEEDDFVEQPSKSTFFTSAMTQTNSVRILPLSQHHKSVQVVESMPLIPLLRQLNERQMRAVQDFAAMLCERESINPPNINWYQQRTFDIFMSTQAPTVSAAAHTGAYPHQSQQPHAMPNYNHRYNVLGGPPSAEPPNPYFETYSRVRDTSSSAQARNPGKHKRYYNGWRR